jgi:hypothetical protein
MNAIKFKVKRIVDFGTIVSMVGVDITSGLPVVVHVDHRPFETIWNEWEAAGFPEPISFDADNLTLCLSVDGDELTDGHEQEVADVPAA